MPNIIHGLSLRSVPLIVKCNGSELFRATGFFMSCHDGKTFLVSNWHVFAGCHPITKVAPLEHGSGVPEEIMYPRLVSPHHLLERAWDTVSLRDDQGNICWFQNPVHGSEVDLAVIEVPSRDMQRHYLQPVESYQVCGSYKQTPRYEMASHLSIIGFPISRRPTGFLPIWIQATVASEMHAGFDGKRAFLVDALTSKGMSGSPVFSLPTKDNPEGDFVGIYSGRQEEGGVVLPLGVVWNRELIYETILVPNVATV